MNEKLENFLLYELSDDWASIATFDGLVARITPEIYSRETVLGVIRELESEIGSNEVFRADLIEQGERRLAELGNPYDQYGDPWAKTHRHTHN
jgi:hypothetical protein